MASVLQKRMPRSLRWVTYLVFGVLWASGCAWLAVHFLWAQPSPFGVIPHPWEPALLRIHGWSAAAAVFLLGWVSSQHVAERWEQWRRRPSGLILGAAAIVLVLSGYALYYTTDQLHDTAAVAHEILGTAALALALVHWRRNGSRRSA